MSTEKKFQLRYLMNLAWQFVKRNGYSLREAMKAAWRNAKLVTAMRRRIVKFWFAKVDGSIREAFGTLRPDIMTPTQGNGRRPNDSLQVYFDTEKAEYRCFKKANLINIAL